MRGRARQGCLSVILALAALLLGGPASADVIPAQAKAVVVDHDAVRLVLSAPGLPAGVALDPTRVTVTSAGRPWPATAQPVAESTTAAPRTAVLVVDTSGSMGAAGMVQARAAAGRFLDVVPPDVAVGLVTFADQARLAMPPTTDRGPVRAALARMRAAGSTTLNDALLIAVAALGSTGDRTLVLLSDGDDTTSRAIAAAAGDALAASGASVDLVAFGPGARPGLEALAARAGGRVLPADNGDRLSTAFGAAARTLVNQVTVTATIPADVTSARADLTVEVGAGAGTVVAAVPVVGLPARSPAAAPAPTTLPATVNTVPSVVSTSLPWLLPVVLVVAFLALFLLFAVGVNPAFWRESSSQRRAREIARYGLAAPVAGSGAKEAAPAAATEAALAWAGRVVRRRGVEDSWRTELDRAAIPLRPQEWLIVRLGVALAAMALAVLALPWALLTAPVAGLLGWLAAGTYVRWRAGRRCRRFADGLPDVLQLIAGSLRSGFSLPQAVDNAAKDGEQPIAGELSRALAESRLGVELEDALERVAERMRSTDLSWTVMAIRISREVGGNLAEVLLSTAETMRERGRILRQVRVLSAEGRLSAYVLIGLPAGITAFMVLFRGSYIAPLLTDPIGWVMTTYGVLSVAVGAWWMSRLVKLEV